MSQDYTKNICEMCLLPFCHNPKHTPSNIEGSELDEILDDFAAGVVLETRTGIFLHECSYFKTAHKAIEKLIHKKVVEARIDEVKRLYKQDIYQINSRDILPNMSVWVIKRDYTTERIKALKEEE